MKKQSRRNRAIVIEAGRGAIDRREGEGGGGVRQAVRPRELIGGLLREVEGNLRVVRQDLVDFERWNHLPFVVARELGPIVGQSRVGGRRNERLDLGRDRIDAALGNDISREGIGDKLPADGLDRAGVINRVLEYWPVNGIGPERLPRQELTEIPGSHGRGWKGDKV